MYVLFITGLCLICLPSNLNMQLKPAVSTAGQIYQSEILFKR